MVSNVVDLSRARDTGARCAAVRRRHRGVPAGSRQARNDAGAPAPTGAGPASICHGRSEEHTSELQSLMRISYAVFCLKKTKKTTDRHSTSTQGNNTIISTRMHAKTMPNREAE